MTIDIETPRSPGWWLNRLASDLIDRRVGRTGTKVWKRTTSKPQRIRPGLNLLHDHLEGDPPLLECAAGWEANFREIVRLGRLNPAALIVEAKSNRMKLRDFRTSAAADELGDTKARDIMVATNMVVVAREVHDGMLSLADSYVIATPPAGDSGDDKWPTVTAEDAREVITADDPLTGRTLVGLKLFRDEWDAADFGYLYIRDEALNEPRDDGSVRRFKATFKGPRSSITESRFRLSKAWEWDEDLFDLEVPQKRMPVVRFRNYRGVGEYEWHLSTLDRINDKIVNEMVGAKTQAFRQRAVEGLPDTQEKVVDDQLVEVDIDYTDVFEAAPGSLWQVPLGVKFWESTPLDLGPIRNAIKGDLEHLAAVTSTPLHLITPDAANGSAQGAALMRESSVDAAGTRIDYVDRPWATVMATCFAYMGDDERADVTKVKPIWGPMERYSLVEKAQAAAAARTTLPDSAIQTDIWQYPPAEVPELRAMRAADLIFLRPGQAPDGATAPPAPDPGPQPEPEPAGGAVG